MIRAIWFRRSLANLTRRQRLVCLCLLQGANPK